MKIEVYSKDNCQFCDKAKRWLKSRSQVFEIKDVADPKVAIELAGRVTATTVPQIFFDNEHIGGYTELLGQDHRFMDMEL